MASTFSYAQAAKGVSTPATASKPASGSATPVKVPTTAPAPGSIASARSWAEDVETESLPDQPAPAREARSQSSSSNTARVSRSVDTSSISSPDLGASSSSTATKDDDVSSIPNTSSESTWDNKSQASTSVDKSVEPVEKTSEKVKKGKNVVVKPLHEAPLPAVNIWKQRADELKAKVQKPATLPTTNGNGSTKAATKKSDSAPQEKSGQTGDSGSRARDEPTQSRKDARADVDIRKGVKGRAAEKDTKAAPSALPPPPNRDQESWPTPETVIDEDRKKAQEKGDKERKDSPATGKHEWVKVPYTPSVVFSTPLPNAANARRGGRPGGRGGVQASGRPTGTSNGAGQTEKDGPEPEHVANGELPKRERADGAGPHDASPKAKNSEAPEVNGDATKASGAATSEAETQARIASESQVPGQSNTYVRQYSSRPSKGRRGDFSGPGERRRDDAFSSSKDGTFTTATQTDVLGDGERRAGGYQDGPNGHHSKQGRYNSFSGGRGERGRGGGRGARANYTNGHHFTNGHQSMQSSSSFTMGPRSPTNFHPGDNSFFSASQGKYGRHAHRSQSVATADPYRYPPYQNGPSVAPMQAFPVYDYGMMQPMNAVPFNSYGVDQFALFSVITTQV